jgi:hypothetical protein
LTLTTQRESLRKAVREALEKKHSTEVGSISADYASLTIEELFEEEGPPPIVGWDVPTLFQVIQGVTWGGQDCETIYRVEEETATLVEPLLVKKTIGGEDITRDGLKWAHRYLIFPYLESKNEWVPAFSSPKLGGNDALDFSKVYSPQEHLNDGPVDRLQARTANGLIDYPKMAKYLVQFYEKLDRREFEGKTLVDSGKSWYEYHRPRKTSLLRNPKIVFKRVMKDPTFCIDEEGYLPTDSVCALIPREEIGELRKAISESLGKSVKEHSCLKYVVAFLNSGLFAMLLQKRRSKKRGGYPIVDEKILSKFVIPKPMKRHGKQVKDIIENNATVETLRTVCTLSKASVKLTDFWAH